MNITDKNQTVREHLSALLDGELSSKDSGLMLDRMLGDPDLMELWRRHQMVHDSMHDQLHGELLKTNLLTRVSQALEEQPAYFTDDPVNKNFADGLPAHQRPMNHKHGSGQQYAEDKEQYGQMNTSWFSRLLSNRIVAGTSVAATVMFATLFTVQHLQQQNNVSVAALTHTSDKVSSPLPTNMVSGNSPALAQSIDAAADTSEHFTWIKADPMLSQQIQNYVKEHEGSSNRSSFNSSFTPRIRAVSYQPKQ